MIDLGADAETARAIQRSAAAAHTSQSEALPLVLARLAGQDHLRWLVPPSRLGVPRPKVIMAAGTVRT